MIVQLCESQREQQLEELKAWSSLLCAVVVRTHAHEHELSGRTGPHRAAVDTNFCIDPSKAYRAAPQQQTVVLQTIASCFREPSWLQHS